jgi:penicillin G amidase
MSSQHVQQDAAAGGSAASPPVEADSTPTGCRRSRRGHLLRRIGLSALGLVLTLVLIATTFTVWSVRRAFPSYDGTIPLSGLSAPVTVYRGPGGAAQVYASSESDLFMAEGYLHAEDRFWEMDFRRHITSGRLAELFGRAELATDAFVRTLGWRHVAEREWQVISPTARSKLQAYADGVNAWLADNGGRSASGAKSLEYTILALTNSGYTVEPWDPIDSLAWLKAMAWDLRGNMNAEIDRAVLLAHGLTRDQIDQLYPRYPLDRNSPIVADVVPVTGSLASGRATDAAAPNLPTSSAGADPTQAAAVWREAAPVLGALGAAVRSLSNRLGADGNGIGSNAWVVNGSLTASGRPLLANDPHLSPSMPGIWYQIGLHCSCAYNATGYSLAGVPGVVIGHNARIAWGLTNLGPDVTDLYLEKVDGGRYYDGITWRDLTLRQEVIRVAGEASVSITVRETRHGPVLSDRSADLLDVAAHPPVDGSGLALLRISPAPMPTLDVEAPGVPPQAAATSYAVALRWTALDPGRAIEAMFALDTASNWAEFRDAAALFDVPAQNMVYADVDGNIGYQAPGRIPIRGTGDGRWPVPGWDSAYDWKGYIPFANLPHVLNPAGGVLVTANQPVTGRHFAYHITSDWSSYGYRSQRILAMIAARVSRGKLGVEDLRQMQFDNRNGFAPVLVPALLRTSLGSGPGAAEAATARNLFSNWDYQQPAQAPGRSSAAAAFYNAAWRHLLARIFDELPADHQPDGGERWWEVVRWLLTTPSSPWWDDHTTPATESMNDILSAAMGDAVHELSDQLGSDPAAWRWGDLHTLLLANESFGQSGVAPIEWLFNRGPLPASGGGGTVNATDWTAPAGYQVDWVPSMRMIVDLSDLDGSRWVQLSGNSGHAFHPNYADQIDLWRTGQNLPMPWTRGNIESAAQHVQTLEPSPSG